MLNNLYVPYLTSHWYIYVEWAKKNRQRGHKQGDTSKGKQALIYEQGEGGTIPCKTLKKHRGSCRGGKNSLDYPWLMTGVLIYCGVR